MNKNLILYCAVLSLLLMAGTATAADSIEGKLGVTGRLGFLIPTDSEAFANPSKLDTDAGFIGGGGFIYGVNNIFAVELDITHSDFDANRAGFKEGDFATTNVSMGVQYRFVNLGLSRLVPYVGTGLDILFNDFSSTSGISADVDTIAGVHVSGGVDYFLTKQLAATAEVKGLLAPDADINSGGVKVGNYDPTSLATTFGIRYFFN